MRNYNNRNIWFSQGERSVLLQDLSGEKHGRGAGGQVRWSVSRGKEEEGVWGGGLGIYFFHVLSFKG